MKIMASDIPVGTVFNGKSAYAAPSIFLRTKNVVVDLQNVGNDYTSSGNVLTFDNYKPVHQSFKPSARKYCEMERSGQDIEATEIGVGNVFRCSLNYNSIFVRSYAFIIDLCNYQDWSLMDEDFDISSDLVIENYSIINNLGTSIKFLLRDEIVDLI